MCISLHVNAALQMKTQNHQALANLKAKIQPPPEMIARHDEVKQQLSAAHNAKKKEVGEHLRVEMLALVSNQADFTLEKMMASMQANSQVLTQLAIEQSHEIQKVLKSQEDEIDRYKDQNILAERVRGVPTLTAKPERIAEITENFRNFFATQSLSPLLQSQQLLLLGDIGSALMVLNKELTDFKVQTEGRDTCENEAQAFALIGRNFDNLCAIGQQFSEEAQRGDYSDEERRELKTAGIFLTSMAGSLDGNYVKPEAKDLPPLDASRKFLVYKAKNGELALKFTSQAARDAFFVANFKDSVGQIPAGKRVGPQFTSNHEGKTPVRYPDNPLTIYFPSYTAKNGEFAVNLGNPENANKLFSSIFPNADGKASRGAPLCGRFEQQPTSLYFNREMANDGKYLRVSAGNPPAFCHLDPIALLAMEDHRKRVALGGSSAAAAAAADDVPTQRRSGF